MARRRPKSRHASAAPAVPRQIDGDLGRAVAHFLRGEHAEAAGCCRTILRDRPGDVPALQLLAMVASRLGPQLGDPDAALELLRQRVAIAPEVAAPWNELGNALSALARHAEALQAFERALTLAPDFVEALNGRGAALSRLERPAEALASLDRALALRPQFVAALNNRAGVLAQLGRSDEALASYDRAIGLAPRAADAHYNRGVLLAALKRHRAALASYDHALALRPAFAEAHNNRAGALAALGRHAEAVASFTRALQLKPGTAEVLKNRGTALMLLGRHGDACVDLERALDLDAGLPFARGALLHSRMHCCDWRDHASSVEAVVAGVRAGRQVIDPFAFLGISDSPADQLLCAQVWARDQCPPSANPTVSAAHAHHRRIRLAYVSSDFRDHPLGHLMAGLFERHDRSRFEVFAFSLGADDGSAMRRRLSAAFDRFIDVRTDSDEEIARRIAEMGIDVAIDRNGFTTGARPGIFARRPAPVQVSYLAYPGTMAAGFIDYIIADDVVIPRAEQSAYAEQVVYLPGSYMVNDSARAIAASTPGRTDAGLPEQGFVFCCFNNNYKITPQVFDIWMRLLHRVDGSVLWLLEGNPAATRNLRREAVQRGVAEGRLVFAPRIGNADHLARHRLADLFVDTLPYNAHTTASDALWAGLPVLTCVGTTFAGRVAASLLRAIGMPGLITQTPDEYEAVALRLARDPAELGRIRTQLIAHRDRWPLFDTARSCRLLEAAYIEMWRRNQRGERPAPFVVSQGADDDLTGIVAG